MKLKSNQTRTYDGDGYKKRAACLCFRSESEEEVRRPGGGRGRRTWVSCWGGGERDGEWRQGDAVLRRAVGARPPFTRAAARLSAAPHTCTGRRPAFVAERRAAPSRRVAAGRGEVAAGEPWQ